MSSTNTISTTECSSIQGKTVMVIGGPWKHFPQKDYPCQIVHHAGWEGRGIDRMLKGVDAVVVITTNLSHQNMWKVKEQAIAWGKPVTFTKATNPQLIIKSAAERMDQVA